MSNHDVEVLAIGAGPANLALAVALEELAPANLADRTLLLEQGDRVAWQRGMLLPWSQSQVSFLKDLVTLRNPRSKFSFVNYLHETGRLEDFINLGTFTPYRSEISDYQRWVAESLERVRVRYGSRVTSLRPRRDGGGAVDGWVARMADGSTVTGRQLVVGAGRDANIPTVFQGLGADRVIHSTQYMDRIAELPRTAGQRVVVIGGAQSAAEMFHSVQQDLPGCEPTLVMRSIGFNHYETSKFTNELFYTGFVDEFFHAEPEARARILQEMHRTNYAGLTPPMLEQLYRQVYLDRMRGRDRQSIRTMTQVTAARDTGRELVLTLVNQLTGAREELSCDVVLLGTGFRSEQPAVIQGLADALGLEDVEVGRDYRLDIGEQSTATVHLQGVNEATHGIADSLLSILAQRSEEIARSLIRHAAPATDLIEPVPTGRDREPVVAGSH
ncbi:lysine N(6)-hydroxylase/L-ornithine N(5)-oxygenase family protein [Streptomyces bicolor]|uniref:lysine N(6)-hydroxylase/L-ornithine N(5)-oxygenase family protein n=1 Tax=Streptomyces bicolor TaxID=66874 RepID=UPI0004E2694F|nr:SidA/IucD/PvdA family monooxygenase [Streptomyces bicolor]